MQSEIEGTLFIGAIESVAVSLLPQLISEFKEKYPDLLGDFYIDINKDKGIRVHDVTCPNLTCEKQGWVNIANLPIVCIPNDVRVVINSTDDSEGNETLGYGGVVNYGKHF